MGKIDYKRARYIFHPEFAVRQAMFVDSKAEKGSPGVARLQVGQTSLIIRQVRAGRAIEVPGRLPAILDTGAVFILQQRFLVKYAYVVAGTRSELEQIIVAALPSGLLQSRYNPSPTDSIWNAGPDAPQRGEKFRTRLAFEKMKAKKTWRDQRIPMDPTEFVWDDQLPTS